MDVIVIGNITHTILRELENHTVIVVSDESTAIINNLEVKNTLREHIKEEQPMVLTCYKREKEFIETIDLSNNAVNPLNRIKSKYKNNNHAGKNHRRSNYRFRR